MGLTNTTTKLSYARNELIKTGVSFVFDKVGDMIYYMHKNNDIGITFAEVTGRTGEGTYLFANGLSIGMATAGDCQGIKMEFDYGVAAGVSGDGKGVVGLDIKMTMDQDWDFGTKPYNATVRAARLQVVSEDDVSGRIEGAYINAIAEGTKEIEGYISGLTGPGMIGVEARTEIQTSATITTPAAVGVLIFHYCKGNATLTGAYRGLQIEQPLILAGGSISGTTTAIYVGNDWGGSDTFDYGLYITSGTCTVGIYCDAPMTLTGTLTATRFIIDNDTWEDDESGENYYWGNRIRMDDTNAFASGAAKKTLALSIHMDRPATNDMTGDSRDYGYYLDYTNRAQNDTGFNILGFRSQLSNRASGTLNIMRGIEQTVRQRGDGSTISDGIEAGLFSCNLDAGGSVPANFAYGLHVHWRFHGNAPSEAAAFCAHNITDGVYTLGAAYALRNDGTSGCKGFTFGLDCYDATSTPISTADIRLSTGIYIMSGSGAPSATAPEGSVYFNTALTGGQAGSAVYLNTDGATNWIALT